MVSPHWEHYPHQADIGVRGVGPSKESAFEQGALALTAVVADPASVRPADAVNICCSAPDDELLFADWLNAVVFEMSVRRMLFSRFDVRLDGQGLEAVAWGEPVDAARHQPAVEVKGATYTTLAVRQLADGSWLAQCVVDV